MKINKKTIYWISAFVLVFVTFWFGHIFKRSEKETPERIVPVEVAAVSTSSIEKTIEVTGWIKANAVVDIKPKVPGRIESLRLILDSGDSVAVEEGLAVKKGQQLAVIDHDVYLAQVEAAKANVKARQVGLEDAERERKRIVALHKGGSATEQSRDKTVTIAELASASLALAKANLELATINLRESRISSPIDGIVTAQHIDEGNLVRTGDRIVTVADLETVKVIIAVSEKYGTVIAVGMPVRIKVDAFGEKIFDTKIYSIYPSLDEQTRTIQAEIRLKNDELLLKPGMFARVTLITQHKDDVVVVVRDVVLGGKVDRHYVYVVKNGIGHKRFVEVGIREADKMEITDGLKAGEALVVNGMNYLTDGISVEVVRIEDIK